jgi:hypothetical protein
MPQIFLQVLGLVHPTPVHGQGALFLHFVGLDELTAAVDAIATADRARR